VLFGLLALTLAGCGDEATLREQAVVGPDPKLLPLRQTLFPTVQIAPPKNWSAGAKRHRRPFPMTASPKPNRRQRR
jgi:hypothetical protein